MNLHIFFFLFQCIYFFSFSLHSFFRSHRPPVVDVMGAAAVCICGLACCRGGFGLASPNKRSRSSPNPHPVPLFVPFSFWTATHTLRVDCRLSRTVPLNKARDTPRDTAVDAALSMGFFSRERRKMREKGRDKDRNSLSWEGEWGVVLLCDVGGGVGGMGGGEGWVLLRLA